MISLKNLLTSIFLYKEPAKTLNFNLPESKEQRSNLTQELNPNQSIFPSLAVNIDYIKIKYHTKRNSDIKTRKFKLNIKGKIYDSFLLFIDGMVNSESINNFILKPIMNKVDNRSKNVSSVITNNIIIRKFNLEEYVLNCLVPQNTIKKANCFDEVFSSVNIGDCALFIDTLPVSFLIDVKGFETRSVSEPKNEIVVRGSQEAFIEKLRTNTSILRRLVNNENLIIENITAGKISNTNIAICYMNNIANDDLVSQVKYRIK